MSHCDRQTTVRERSATALQKTSVSDDGPAAEAPPRPAPPSFTGTGTTDGGFIPGGRDGGIGREGGRIPTAAHLTLSPDHFDFQVQSLDSYTHQAFTLKNDGESFATGIAAGGLSDPFGFKGGGYPGDGGTCGTSLAPGAQCRLILTFRPTVVGRVRQSTFRLGYNAGELGLLLEGTGTAIATLKLVNLVDEQSAYDFGSIPFGGSLSHVFRVKYYGARPATGVSFSSLGGAFAVVWNHCPTEIAADCDLAVRYFGSVNGRNAQKLKLTYDNGAFAAASSQDLSGTTASEITQGTLQIGDVSFGRRLVGSQTEATVTVRKSGSRAVHAVHATPLHGAFDFKGGFYPGLGGTCSSTISTDCTVVVAFAPSAAIDYSGSLVLAYTREDGARETVGFLSGRGAAPARLTLTPVTDHDFGTIPVGRPADRHFNLRNTDEGLVALNLSAIGAQAPFRLLSDCATSLSPGQSCTLTVRFQPTEPVPASGQLTVIYFDGVENRTISQPFTGDGGDVADLHFTQSTFDFGNLAIGTRQLIEVNIEYYGVLTGGNCTIGGIPGGGVPGEPGTGDDGGFEFPGGEFPGGGTCTHDINGPCTIRVTFIPREVRTYSTVLTLYYDDGTGHVRSTTVTLRGRGLGTTPARLGFERPTVDFGDVIASSRKSLTVKVLRQGDLAATQLALGGLGTDLSFLGGVAPGTGGTCGATLNQASCTYVLAYSPTSAGALGPRTVSLSYHDGETERTASFVVAGRAYDAANLVADAVDFGKVPVGDTASRVIAIVNSGRAPATSLLVVSGPGDPYSIADNGCGASIAPGGRCEISIRLAPSRPGKHHSSMAWQYENGRETAALSVALTGAGKVPVLVSAGGHHTCARPDDGSVRCWGHNLYGQLGLGDSAHRSAPSAPVDLGPGRYAKSIVAGFWHSCALLDDGAVKCWGANTYGQLGRPGAESAVDLNGRTVDEIAAGYSHTCARFHDGKIACWGFNGEGQLGLGDTRNRGETPDTLGDALAEVDLDGLVAGSIAASTGNTCALGRDGSLKCWGNNFYGQLGLGDFTNRGDAADQLGAHLPAVDVGPSAIRAVAAGGAFVCALQTDGRVKCWGRNETSVLGTLWCQDYDGRIGGCADSYYSLPLRGYGLRPGLMGDRLAPIELSSTLHATSISAGNGSACARLENGDLKCWGENANGQLGLGDTDPRGRTVLEMGDALPAVSLGSAVESFSVGASHACAVLATGSVKCWGGNRFGELGVGDTENRGDAPNEMGTSLPAIGL